MLPHRPYRRDLDAPTTDEYRAVFSARLEALEAAIQQETLQGALPVRWRVGWKATVTWLGRDRDGSLRAKITVTEETKGVVYTRNVRCVKEQRLNRQYTDRVARS